MDPTKTRTQFNHKWVFSLYFIISFLFVLLCKAIGDLSREGNVLWTGSYLLETLLISILLGALLGACLGTLFFMSQKVSHKEAKPLMLKGRVITLNGKVIFLGSTLLLLLAWLPYFLAYFPCIAAYDIGIQMGQITNDFYYDHHPLMHTLTLRIFLSLGTIFF